MQLSFESLSEDLPGPLWASRFEAMWPAYRRWYLSGGYSARPTYLECERALKAHMPQFVQTWERMVELAGGGDLEARFLSLYCPPPYVTGCSQAAWVDPGPMLVRNYDYSPLLCERLVWRTRWNGKGVIAVSDCLVGALDGINSDGLAVSLSFGGHPDAGRGFGAPMAVRYVLEFCGCVAEAAEVLRKVPINMAYNILLLDASGDYMTAFSAPDGPTILHRTPATTNHQDRVVWERHAEATGTLERERRLYEMLEDKGLDEEGIVSRFLEPPLYRSSFRHGHGTLYTAVYRPGDLVAEYRWPGCRWMRGFDDFSEEVHQFEIPWEEGEARSSGALTDGD